MQDDGHPELGLERRGLRRGGRGGRAVPTGQREREPDHDKARFELRYEAGDRAAVHALVTAPRDD